MTGKKFSVLLNFFFILTGYKKRSDLIVSIDQRTKSRIFFDELPDVLHQIFQYIDIQTILYSIRLTCKRLQAIVKTYNKFKIDFFHFAESHLDFIRDFIQPENVTSLTLTNRKRNQLSQMDLFCETRTEREC